MSDPTLYELALACALNSRFDADGGVARIEAFMREREQAAFEMAANLVDYNGNAKLNRWASNMIRELAKERAKR